MLWLLVAVGAHVVNAFVYEIDKNILGTWRTRLNEPARYAAYSGIVAAGAVWLLLLAPAAPSLFVVVWSLVAGALWMFGLWVLFVALKNGEPSRVVPLSGVSTSVCAVAIGAVLLGEWLPARELLAVGVLVAGGGLLSLRAGALRPAAGAGTAVLSGVLFAAYFAVVALVYRAFDPFLAAFAYTRLGVGVWALVLIVLLAARASPMHQQRAAYHAAVSRPKIGTLVSRRTASAAFAGSKLLGAVALVLQSYAVREGSVAVVNALQGVQYAVVLVLAVVIARMFPRLFAEELRRVTLRQKIGGIVLVSAGLGLLLI